MKNIHRTALLILSASSALYAAADDPAASLAPLPESFSPRYFVEQPNFTNTEPLAVPLSLMTDESALPAVIDEILAEARTHLGTRYRHGGKSPSGFDCSGFTGYVFNQFGYRLSASSKDQYVNAGIEIPTSEIRPGDLLFFKGRNRKSVGHVAIAVEAEPDGDITFIHAAVKGGIRFDRVSSRYYKQRFLGARRVVLE